MNVPMSLRVLSISAIVFAAMSACGPTASNDGGTGGGAAGGGTATGGGTGTGGGTATGGGATGGGAGGGATGGGVGTGGGSTGGGTGTGGGTVITTDDAGCTVYSSWPTTQAYGRYINTLPERAVGALRGPVGADGGYSVLQFEHYYVFNPAVPLQRIYDGGVTYYDCDFCSIIIAGCTLDGGACLGGMYLAQEGTVNASRVGGRDGGGIFTTTASNLKFVQWEFLETQSTIIDRPKDGGSCIVVGSAEIDAGID